MLYPGFATRDPVDYISFNLRSRIRVLIYRHHDGVEGQLVLSDVPERYYVQILSPAMRALRYALLFAIVPLALASCIAFGALADSYFSIAGIALVYALVAAHRCWPRQLLFAVLIVLAVAGCAAAGHLRYRSHCASGARASSTMEVDGVGPRSGPAARGYSLGYSVDFSGVARVPEVVHPERVQDPAQVPQAAAKAAVAAARPRSPAHAAVRASKGASSHSPATAGECGRESLVVGSFLFAYIMHGLGAAGLATLSLGVRRAIRSVAAGGGARPLFSNA
jgi:hypothetical protein